MPERVRSVAVGYYIAVTLLVIGLAIGFALVTRIADPAAGGGIDIGAPFAVPCEVGDGTPSCFGFSVRNASSQPVSLACDVIPAAQTSARFGEDASTTVMMTLLPGQEDLLRTFVDTDGGDAVAAPSLQCSPVSDPA